MSKINESRREFLKKTAVAAVGITIVPNFTVSGLGHRAPSDKLNIVGIGIGGKGHPNLVGMNTENIVGLCDMDWKYAKNCFNEFPKAKRYWDWRMLFDEMGNSFDAVMVATATKYIHHGTGVAGGISEPVHSATWPAMCSAR